MADKVTTAKRRKYDSTFKLEAIRMINSGRSVSEVSSSLGVGENLLYKWKNDHQLEQKEIINGDDSELKRLRLQVKQLEQERDILKKALLIFGQNS